MHARARGLVVVAAATVSVGLSMAAGADAAQREFAKRFGTVATGSIAYATNVLSTCGNPPSAACVSARSNTSITSSSSALNNNSYEMVEVDVDSDPSTSNSSTAELEIPVGSSVLWAGLYWTASSPSGLSAAVAKQAKLRGPDDSGYTPVTASVFDPAPSVDYGYDCFAEVTGIVQAQGAGTWTFGGIPIRTGRGTVSGWSLIVDYAKPGLPLRDLNVYDGQVAVSGTNLVSIPISGFRTPATGAVKSEVGFVAFEGDRSASGDYLQLDGTILTDAAHPANNTFNSWIARLGAAPPGRNPSYANQLGFDASVMAANGILANNATSAVLRAKTNGDAYMPIAFSFATDLYSPIVDVTKSVTDVNGGEVRIGDELAYEMTVTSSGDDGAVASILREDAMPDRTEYVAGSLEYDPGSGYAAVTDTAGDDLGEAEGGSGGLAVRIGQGADADNGGLMAKGTTWKVRFKVKVTSLPEAGGAISNIASVDYASQTLGSAITAVSPEAKVTVRRPDASITKTISSAQFDNGLPATYTLSVSNRGDSATEGETVVTDSLPAAFASPSVTSSTGWDCSIAGSDLTCKRSDALGPGRSWPSIVIASPGLVIPAGETVINGAEVSTPLDSDPTNDLSAAAKEVGIGVAALPVAIAADVGDVLPGEPAVFIANFNNVGPSSGPNAELSLETVGITGSDVEATGFTVTSSDGSITSADCQLTQSAADPVKVTCSKASIAAGVSVEIQLTLVPRPGTTKSEIEVRASGSIDNDPAKPRQASTTVPIVPTADLAVTKQASVATVDPGEAVDFTIRVTNEGPADDSGVRVVDVIPLGLAVESATWTRDGGPSDVPCQISGRTVECGISGTLAAASSASGSKFAEVKIRARSDGTVSGPLVNRAGSHGDLPDPFPDNDSAEVTVTSTPWAELSISKSGPGTLKPGAQGAFTIVVTNSGPSDARDVTMTDTLPVGLSVDPADPLVASGMCRLEPPAGRTVVCQLINDPTVAIQDGVLASGESWTINLKAKLSASASPGANLVNSAEADSSTPHDPVSASDNVRVTVASAASKRLGISISGPRASIAVGRSAAIRVKVSAPRSTSVTGVSLCVALPGNLRYVSSSGRRSGGRICWTLGTLKAGASRSFTIRTVARRTGSGSAAAAARGSGASRVTAAARVRTHSFTG